MHFRDALVRINLASEILTFDAESMPSDLVFNWSQFNEHAPIWARRLFLSTINHHKFNCFTRVIAVINGNWTLSTEEEAKFRH